MSILYYFIDEETRKLRPEAAHKVVAQKDHNADVIRIGIPETMDSVDFETSAVRCMYQRPKETEVRSKTATYYDTSGGYLWYDWTLQEGDTAKAGKINFSVCLQHIEGGLLTVDWNTTIGEIFVKTSYHSDDSDEADETINPTVAQRVAVLETMIQRVASGAPTVVASASDMTDTAQIYVLSTDGMWYYHNGTAWTAGGEYGAVATDTTLSQPGIPADAKVVGDAINAVASGVEEVQDALEHLDVETDKTLSIDGEPADAKKTGDEISGLKNAIIEDGRLFDIKKRSIILFNPIFVQGQYDSNTGIINSSAVWVRSASLIPINSESYVLARPSSSTRWYACLYDDKQNFIATKGAYATGKKLNASDLNGASYISFSLSRTDSDTTSVDDVSLLMMFDYKIVSIVQNLYSSDRVMSQFVESVANGGDIIVYPDWEEGRYASASADFSLADGYIKTVAFIPVMGGGKIQTQGLGTTTLLTEVDRNKNFVKQTTITSAPLVTLQESTAFVGGSATSTSQTLTPSDGEGYYLTIKSNLATKADLTGYATQSDLNDYVTTSALSSELESYVEKSELDALVNNVTVPSYFETQLNTKIPTIIENMNACGDNGETFIFITDTHWETNYRQSPTLIKYILNHTKINHIIHGGDLINQGEKMPMYQTIIESIRAFQFGLCDNFLPICRGNHDDNSNWVSSEDITAHEFDYNTVFALLYKDIANKVTFIYNNDFSFWYDSESSKTRFIFVDMRRDGRYIPYEQLKVLMNATPVGYKLVFIAHYIYYKTNGTFRQGATGLLNMISAFNAKTSGSYIGVNYDFTNSNGKVVCVLAGHTHEDFQWAKDDSANVAGVPIIITDTDSWRNDAAEEGTVNSQCFDVVTIDYVNNVVKCVRIGRGNDRTLSFDLA